MTPSSAELNPSARTTRPADQEELFARRPVSSATVCSRRRTCGAGASVACTPYLARRRAPRRFARRRGVTDASPGATGERRHAASTSRASTTASQAGVGRDLISSTATARPTTDRARSSWFISSFCSLPARRCCQRCIPLWRSLWPTWVGAQSWPSAAHPRRLPASTSARSSPRHVLRRRHRYSCSLVAVTGGTDAGRIALRCA